MGCSPSKSQRGDCIRAGESEPPTAGASPASGPNAALPPDQLLAKAAAEADECSLADGSTEWAFTFDGGVSFHLGEDLTPLPADSKRYVAEAAAFKAVQAVDNLHSPTPHNWAVSLEWLVHTFLPSLPRKGMLTYEVVSEVIKPATRRTRARYVEIMPPGTVGTIDVFISHTWGAPFSDLCSAVKHAVGEESAFVWIDIFAVRQWPGNSADVDFRPTVEAAKGFLLVARHIDELAIISPSQVRDGKLNMIRQIEMENGVPTAALRACAFFRVWCVVEVVAALRRGKPTVMMVGRAAKDGSFEPNSEKHRTYKDTKVVPHVTKPLGGMLQTLYEMVDVRLAVAKVAADRQRELEAVEKGPGFEATNLYARGAIMGAMWSMGIPEVLRSALAGGRELDLDRIPLQSRSEALLATSALGLTRATTQLLLHGQGEEKPLDLTLSLMRVGDDASEKDVDSFGQYKHTPLGAKALELAALGGHASVLKLLLEQGSPSPTELQVGVVAKEDPNFYLRKSHPEPASAAALREAALHGHVAAAEVLLDHGAPVDARAPANQYDPHNGKTALVHAARYGQAALVSMLLGRRASPDLQDTYSSKKCEPNKTPLHYAADHGHKQTVEVLLSHGATPGAVAHDGQTPLHLAVRKAHIGVCELLLRHGASPDAHAKYAGTPIKIAEECGHAEILERLRAVSSAPTYSG